MMLTQEVQRSCMTVGTANKFLLSYQFYYTVETCKAVDEGEGRRG